MNRCPARDALDRQCFADNGHDGDHFRYGDPADPRYEWPNIPTVIERLATTLGRIVK